MMIKYHLCDFSVNQIYEKFLFILQILFQLSLKAYKTVQLHINIFGQKPTNLAESGITKLVK